MSKTYPHIDLLVRNAFTTARITKPLIHFIRRMTMFRSTLIVDEMREQRIRKEPILPERLQPDCPPIAGWLRRLALGWFRLDRGEIPPRQAVAETFVPDGRLGLLIRDGKAAGWVQPGRHLLDPESAKIELRLFASEHLTDRIGEPLDGATALLYERALLFVDGVHVATVIPGRQPGDLPRERGERLRSEMAPLKEPSELRPVGCGEEEDPVRDFSFV